MVPETIEAPAAVAKREKVDIGALMLPPCVVAAFEVAASEAGRFALQGVMLDATGETLRVEACDGRYLVRADYAMPEGADALRVIVPADAVPFLKAAVQAVKRHPAHGPQDSIVRLVVSDGGGVDARRLLRLECAVTGSTLTVREVEGSWPDTATVIPSGPVRADPVRFDPLRLATLTKAMLALTGGEKDARSVTLETRGSKSPLTLRRSHGGVDVVGVLMPIA